ncbi:MAG: fibronectin type III domain-containing protein [Planctomycetes bacterium]|nr:fibronectin type III domain-containing protein [Planctomycetota bacterium]
MRQNGLKIFGVDLRRWHLYFIVPLVCLMIAGCAAGLLLVGTAMSGSSGGGTSSGSSAQRRVTGLVFSQGSENVIAPLGGASVMAEWGSTRSILGAFTKAVTMSASTTTNSDGSYELDGIDDGANVVITIEKDGHTTQIHNVNTAGSSPSIKGTLAPKNQNKKTVFSSTDNDINTDEDVNEKGEPIARCHVVISAGAVTGDTEVELTPYYSLDNLPQPLPAGYIGLAGADFSAASTVVFATNKDVKPYLVLPSTVRASELNVINIKLMELIEVSGVKQWLVSKNAINQDRACEYYTSGPYEGMLGPDDGVIDDNQAKLKGIRPFCFVYSTTQLATINGTVKNTTGTAIAGAMVFGGGSSDTTNSLGKYSLNNVIALSASSDTLIMVNAIAPNYQLASAVASVRANSTTNNVNITLETLEEVAILGGSVKDASTISPIAGAKVVCTSQPYIAAFTYDNRGTTTDLMDDTLSVTPPANLRNYRWNLTSPSGVRYQSASQINNWVILSNLFSESGFDSLGSYRVDLGITLSDDRVVTATGGFMLKIVSLSVIITDIRLPVSMDPSITMEAYSNTVGNYRMIGVPTGVELKLQASKTGYQSSGIRTISALTKGATAVENFTLNAGSAAVASIWITPAPSVSLQTGQTVLFSGVAKDDADNTISPTPVFTWISSNPAIASINSSSGLASALGSGSVTIEASTGAVTSNAVTVTVGGVPAAPSDFTAVAASSSQIDLAWQDNSANEDDFRIERSTNGITYALISTQYPDVESYSDTGLSSSTQYYYRVYSRNVNGDSAKASASATTPGTPVPNGPSALIVTPVDANTIDLEWTDNSNNETLFQIRRSPDGDTYNVIATVGANTTSYQNIGLTPNSNYYYRVYARNDSGNSTTYASGDTWTPDTIPTAPSGLVASNTSSSQINLTWTDASNNESGFKIERSPNGVDTWTEIYTTTINATSYPNTGLVYNTTYYYRIRAYNTAGDSNYSNIAFATTSQQAPDAPTGATITVLSDTSIKIDWTDASDNEDSFKVQISTDGTTYTLKTTTAANATVFTDTGLTALTTYWYRVYAYNTAGSSGYSNVVSDTTNAPPIPDDPTNLVTTTVTSSSIGLQWTDNSNNETGFKLDRSPDGVSNWVTLTTTAGNVIAFSDTALTPATTFYYRVYAYNLGGDSGYASVTAATFAVPDNLAFSVQPVNTAAGATFPAVQVTVRDASNNPLALDGIPITFTINKGTLNGTLSKNTVAGVATFSDLNMTLADTGYAITASSGGLTPAASNAFNITFAAANNLTWVTSPANSVAGSTMAAFTVRVRDAYANNVQGTTVSVTTTNSALAVYQGGTAVADYATAGSGADGLATFSTISMTAAGTGYVFRASSGALATVDSGAFNITPDAADNLAFVQQPTTTSAGATMSPVTVRVKDVYDNLISGQAVSITTTDGTLINGTLTQNSDINGIATFTPLSMTAPGTGYVLSATSGALVVTSDAFNISGAAANLAFVQQPANTMAGATMSSITVLVRDQFNDPQPGITISLTTTNGTLINGTLSKDSDINGVATFDDLSITLAANNYALSASALTYTVAAIVSTSFNITPASANSLTFFTQPANTVAGVTMSIVRVRVWDQYANVVPSVAVSLTTTTQLNGTATITSNAIGIAAFNDLYITTTGTYQLSARAGAVGPTSSNNFDITPGAVMTVAVSGDTPITSGIESSSYTAVSRDAYNNNVSDTYAWTKANGTGTATLSVDKLTGVLSGTVTITATSDAAPAKSGGKTVTVNPGAPSSLTFVQQPTTATVSVAITPAITVRVKDVNNNLLSGVSVSVTTTGGTALSGTLTRSSDSGGIATFNDLSIASEGNYSLYATTGLITTTSASFNIMPTLPNVPSGLTATAISPTAITITWTDTSNNESGFKIERFISGSYQEIATTTANTAVYTNNGLSGNTLYYYKVRAYNVTGNSDYSNVASAQTPIAPPTAPSGLITTSVTASVISLQWNDNSSNEDNFKLERSDDNGATYTVTYTISANTTVYTNTGLSENTTYWYRVLAINGGGSSGYSNAKSATTLLPLPTAPSTMTATAASSSQINLAWQDNSSNETGFKVERSPNGSTGWGVILTPTANSTSISNTGLSASTTYYYRILAYNATGNSGYSNNASATTFEVPPVTPTNLTISATAYNSVVLTWTDTANNETGFKLERKPGGGSYSQIATPTANATAYTDNSVSPNTTYYYKIRAYNTAGNSGYSNEASTTTPLPPIPNAPTGLVTNTITSVSIGMQWTDNSTTEDGFKVERASAPGGPWFYLDQVSTNITAYNNTGLGSGLTYYYRVYAYNTGGSSGYSNVISGTTPIIAPNAPTGLVTTTVTSSAIGLQWTDNSLDENSFKVERSIKMMNWVAGSPSTVPEARVYFAMAYDSVRKKTVLFGGQNSIGNPINDTWEWDGTNWTQRTPVSSPSARMSHMMVYDSFRQKTVLFGGLNGPTLNDTWEWDGTNWTQRSPGTSPSTRRNSGMAYDSVRQKTVLFGGFTDGGPNNETWEWNGTTWTQSSPASYPSMRYLHTMCYDSVSQKTVLFGGITGGYDDQTWEWDGTTWTQRWPGSSPSARFAHTMVYDSARNQTVLFGGYDSYGPNSETWEWDGASGIWTPVYGGVPTARYSHAMAYDSGRQKAVMFGGNTGVYMNDTWEWSEWEAIAEVGANVTTLSNSPLPASTTYWYRVYAYNTAGPSGMSNVISATTLPPPPPAGPTGLIASAQAIDKIQLNWNDNSGDEDGFRIYRSTNGITYSQIVTLTLNTTVYQDMPVSSSVVYYYRVTAYSAYSGYGDSSAAETTGFISTQPDAMIRLSSESDALYTSNNVYESTPVSQTKGQTAESYKLVSYYIRVQNDGNLSDSFKITGSGSSGNWTVTYYDVTYGEAGPNITFDMTWIFGPGYVPSIAAGGYITIRMEVSQSYAQTGSYYDAVVRVASQSDPARVDTVKARTEAIPAYYSISGSVSYTGTKTGRIYLGLNWFSYGGEPGSGTSIPAVGAFTIRGVQSGDYSVYAWMDTLSSGNSNAGNPNGATGLVSVTSTNVTGVNIVLSDPVTPTPTVPDYVQVFPSDSSGLAFYDTPKDGNGKEIASSYRVYWHTSPTVSKSIYLGYKTIPANQDDAAFITGLTNGWTYYFVITALVGTNESAESAASAGLIGPAAGSYNVSGTVFYPGVTPTGPLYVGVYNDAGAITYTRIASPAVSSQTYSFAGVANGTYMLWASLDMNNNGLMDAGDCKDTEGGTFVTVNNANLTDQNKTLPTGYGTGKVETEHRKIGTEETYSLNIKVASGRKLVVACSITSGPGITAVLDIDKRDREFRRNIERGLNRPITSDNYALNVTYSDATTETLNAPVTAVLDCFAQNLSPTTITGGHVVPTFTWAAPASPPASYSYYLWVNEQNGGDLWRYPDKSDMPSSQLAVLYNTDSRASQPNLDIGSVYYWYVLVSDSNRNKASQGVSYSPTYFDRQADALIGLSSEAITSYLTDNLYESNPVTQTKYQDALKGQVVSYVIRVQNEGASAESLIITGTAGNSSWIVKYFDGATDVTANVTGAGYTTPVIASCGYRDIRLEVNSTATATVGSTINVFVTAKSWNDPSKKDMVKATTTRVNSYAGLGNDGSLNVTGLFYIDSQTNGYNGRSQPDGWSSRVSSLTPNSADLYSTPAAGTFYPNDEFILISVKGAPSTNVGNYEFLRVYSVSGSTVYFTCNKTKYYGDTAGSDANAGSNQYVFLQRVPNYSSVLVNWNSELTCNDWYGSGGGVLAFRASSTVYVGTSGKSDYTNRTAYIRSRGFSGGSGSSYSGNSASGDAYNILSTYSSGGYAYNGAAQNGLTTPNPGGGGGGAGDTNDTTLRTGSLGTTGAAGGGGGAAYGGTSATKGGGGGGGGYCTVGTNGLGYTMGTGASGSTGGTGGNSFSSSTQNNAGGGGGGGSFNSPSSLNSRAFFGAGGGAGGATWASTGGSYGGTNGGKGGGFIYIGAAYIYVYYNVYSTYYDYGYITVNGENGKNVSYSGNSLPGGGGGGAGGSIITRSSVLYIGHTMGVTCYAGAGSVGGSGYGGGAGGWGGIYYQYSSLTGNSPAPNTYSPGTAPSE